MLYIFRYFKEIQISIFVIKTMFEVFWLVCVVIKCVRIFHTVCFLARSVLLYQSSPVSFALCSHFSVCPHVSLCGAFTPNEPSVSVPALSETPDPALNFAVWGNRPQKTAKHSKLSPAMIKNLFVLCVAGRQWCSIEKQKTKGFFFFFFFYTGVLTRLVELFSFDCFCSPQSDFLWRMTLFSQHVPFWCHSKEPFYIWKDIYFKQFVSFVYFYGATLTQPTFFFVFRFSQFTYSWLECKKKKKSNLQ